MNIVPATQELVDEFYGTKLPVSVRGFFILNDEGKPIGTGGFIRRSANVMVLYSEGREEVYTHHKKAVVKLARMLLDIADRNGWTLIADADDTKETADGFLAKLGFEQGANGVYVRWPFLGR